MLFVFASRDQFIYPLENIFAYQVSTTEIFYIEIGARERMFVYLTTLTQT